MEKGKKENLNMKKRIILNKLHWITEATDIRNGVKGYTTSRSQANFFPTHSMKHHLQSVNSMVGMTVYRQSLEKMLCRSSNQGCGAVP